MERICILILEKVQSKKHYFNRIQCHILLKNHYCKNITEVVFVEKWRYAFFFGHTQYKNLLFYICISRIYLETTIFIKMALMVKFTKQNNKNELGTKILRYLII